MTIRVGVLGAQGRMGSEVCRAVDGADDMDLWAERIPYPETEEYVRKVYTYYGRYRLVYGAAG